jgi:hypothetical protein
MTKEQDKIKKVYLTIFYFNCLKHPPTTFEVWFNFLDIFQKGERVSLLETEKILLELKNKDKIFLERGFWVIKDRKFLGKNRIELQKKSIAKLKKIKKTVRWIRFLPFIRGVFITGTLSFQTASRKSDWDVLVITKKDKIWLGRLILTIFLFFIGQKRANFKIKNRFCLNHFLTEKTLIPEKRNEYTSYEYSFIFPVLNQKIFFDFMRLNWTWMRKISPNFQFYGFQNNRFLVDNSTSQKIQKLFEISLEAFGIGGFINQVCKKWMTKRINEKSKNFSSEAVIIHNDGELAFWPDFKTLNKILKL